MSAVEIVVATILMVVSSLFVSRAVMAAADPSQADLPLQVLEKGPLMVSIHHAPDFRSPALADVAPLFQAQDRVLRSLLLVLALAQALLSFPSLILQFSLFSTWKLCDHLLLSVCLCLWQLTPWTCSTQRTLCWYRSIRRGLECLSRLVLHFLTVLICLIVLKVDSIE